MLDEIILSVIAGAGGDGAVSFRRERYVPRGGPDGGDGGNGGSVIIVADTAVQGLDGLKKQKTVRAEAGQPGQPGKRHGRNGCDVRVAVPVGTIVWQLNDTEEQLADLRVPGMEVVVARGGSGGRGNARLSTATRRAPRIAERGLPGERRRIRLELRLLAEVGLVGLPNAGKSALLRAVSPARPKIGAYPFTTLEPYLGVIERGYERIVVADIPGLIEGAHEGAGLGVGFLQHIRRTRVLVHVLDAGQAEPLADLQIVRDELAAFGQGLPEKPWLVALNKVDLPEARERATVLASELEARRIRAYPISALTGEGVPELVATLFERVREERARALEQSDQRAEQALRPEPAKPFEVVRGRRGFIVRGQRPAEVIARLGVESEEARAEVSRRLRRIGVLAALRRAGIEPGDRVRIGEAELEWPI